MSQLEERTTAAGGTTNATDITPELFQMLCSLSLMEGTAESIFLCCFMVWTWNLACRGHDTAQIKFSQISWDDPNNDDGAISVFGRHVKTDQRSNRRGQGRRIYPNLFFPVVIICFVTGLYLDTCFQANQATGQKLFPGNPEAVEGRASDLLKKLLEAHEQEILGMGYDSIADIRLCSFRKGVISYLASLPGGPSSW